LGLPVVFGNLYKKLVVSTIGLLFFFFFFSSTITVYTRSLHSLMGRGGFFSSTLLGVLVGYFSILVGLFIFSTGGSI